MLDNVRAHSLLVAKIATRLAERAYSLGLNVDVAAVRASALLHDIAKTWCLRNGGSHAVLGAAWTAQETGHYEISQGVLLHVGWPWPLPAGQDICRLAIFVLYADKRVQHDQFVSLSDRYDDILIRYGRTEGAKMRIQSSREQAAEIEKSLANALKWSVDEDLADRRRLVD